MFNNRLIQSLERDITRLSSQVSDLHHRLEYQAKAFEEERSHLMDRIIAICSPSTFATLHPPAISESKLSFSPSGKSRMAPGLPTQVRPFAPLPLSSPAADLGKEICPVPKPPPFLGGD